LYYSARSLEVTQAHKQRPMQKSRGRETAKVKSQSMPTILQQRFFNANSRFDMLEWSSKIGDTVQVKEYMPK
jgi:hypothetical protein